MQLRKPLWMHLVTVPWLMQDFLVVNMGIIVLGVTVTSHHQILHHIQIPGQEGRIRINSVVLTMEYHHLLTTVGPEIIKAVVHEVVVVSMIVVEEEAVDTKIVIVDEVALAAPAAILQDLDTLRVVLQVIMALEVAEVTKAKEVDKLFITLIGVVVVGAVNRPHRIPRVEAGTPAVVAVEVRVMAQADTRRHLTHLPQGVVQDSVEKVAVVVELDEMVLAQALGVTEVVEPHEMMVTTPLTIIIVDVN